MQPDQNIRLQIENIRLVHPEIVEDNEAWLATLESETDFNEILTTIVRRLEDTKALAAGTEYRLQELKARRDRFEHRIETLRELAFKIMQAADLPKIELPEATLSLRAGQQQLVGDADPMTLPHRFRHIVTTANKAAIKDALKTGETVEGFQLSNSPPSLSIRVK